MAKYDILKTKKLKFARFGGLSSVNQKGYQSVADTFHEPPATRGFYCFVCPYYEFFLLGGSWTKDPWNKGTKFSYVRDAKGGVIDDKHPDCEKITDKGGSQYWSCQTKAWAENRGQLIDMMNAPSDEGGASDKRDAFWSAYEEKEKALDLEWETNHKDEAKWVLCQKPSPKIFEYNGDLWHHLGDKLKQFQIIARHGKWVKSSVEDYRVALEKETHEAKKEAMKMFFTSKHKFLPTARAAIRYGTRDHLEVFIEKV